MPSGNNNGNGNGNGQGGGPPDDHGGGPGEHGNGPRYCLNIEGQEHFDWREPTITMEKIAELGGWPVAQGVVMVLEDNSERNLQLGEIIELQPGRGFCRRVRWKRGFSRQERIEHELALIRKHIPSVEYKDGWVKLPSRPLPPGWNRTHTDIAFQMPDGYPGAPPYGIYVPAGVLFNGTAPQDYTDRAGTPSVDRDEILSVLIPWLESRGIYSRGRFGMWKYEVANTDHTLMQGVELVNRLILNEPETTIGVLYRVTHDGRQAAVHERSPKAGSGIVARDPAPNNVDVLHWPRTEMNVLGSV